MINLNIENFIFQGGREVLGRTIVLRGSSECLNIGSCSFLLVGAKEIGELVLPSRWC